MVDFLDRFYQKLASWREPGIHVSALTYECMRRGYYGQAYQTGFFSMDTMLRFFIGNSVHTMPVLKYHEFRVDLEGVTGTVDEYEDGTLVDKKHTANKIPNYPPEHYVKQVEFYKIMLESKGMPVIDAAIFYIDVVTPSVKLIPVKLRKSKEILDEFREKRDILKTALDTGVPPKRVPGWHCNYCNFASICWMSEELTAKKDRWAKAEEIAGQGKFTDISIDDDMISAKYKDGDKEYAVFFSGDEYFCSCTDHVSRHVECKHLLALAMEVKDQIPMERYVSLIRREKDVQEGKSK